jgi:hypothetical protein
MATYEDNFSNPITSQYDPRIAEGGRVDSSGNVVGFNPEMVGMFSKKTASQSDTKERVYRATDGTEFTDQAAYATYQASLDKKSGDALIAQQQAALNAANKQGERQSAYDLLYSQFKQYGLESLVAPLKGLITSGASPSEFTIKLRETDAYKKRFAGNASRIQNGLAALDEATYLAKEDAYQNLMRNYGLPASYWEKDAMGTQQGFTDLIAYDVSALELENRLQEAVNMVDKGPQEYMDALKQYYPEINRGDLLAYVLDPKNALTKIQSKLGAAKIGGEYARAGLESDVKRAEFLQREGVTAEKARQGAQAVLETAPRGSQLADIYKQGPYGQAEVESEVYGLAGAADAKKKRQKITDLETASFGAKSGVGALARDTGGLY